MLRKAKSRVKRIGLKSYKAIFSIRVLKVTIPREVCIYEAGKPCQLSVSFERGGKMASTTGQDVNIIDSLAVATFDEKLTLVATLYGNEAGEFQEKKGKIIVRQYQNKFFKMSSYRLVGSVTIDLRFVANKAESNVLILPLENCSDGSSIEITIQGEVLGENDDNDETMSINSDSSSGTLSSVLGLNNNNGSSSALHTLSTVFGFGSSSPAKSDQSSINGDAYDSEQFDYEHQSTSLDNSQGKVSLGNSSISGHSQAGSYDNFETTGDNSKRDYISSLEVKLFKLQRQHDDELKKVRDQLELLKMTSSRQIDALNREIIQLKDKRSLTEKLRDTLSLTSSTGKVVSKTKLNESSDSMEEKLRSTQEALASAIASTEMEAYRRASKEMESEAMMDDLIDTKIRYAHVASELDVERVRTLKLREKLKLYIERLTTMEVKQTKR